MLFSRVGVEIGLQELVDALAPSDEPIRIHVVGGAAVILRVDRPALTADIDTLRADATVLEAAERIARVHGWPAGWLNDAAKMWASHHDTDEDWEVRFSRGHATVLIARAPLLLAMKLQAGRGRRDAEDIDLLAEACKVDSVEHARDIFDRYYPTEEIAPRALRQIQERFGSGSAHDGDRRDG